MCSPVHRLPQVALAAPLLALMLSACAGGTEPDPAIPDDSTEAPLPIGSGLGDALTFHASFDRGIDADHASGDGQLFTAPSYEEQDQAVPGLGNPSVEIASGVGHVGDALRFNARNEQAIFYRAADNLPYSAEDWSGTVSFWLSLDPAVDLEPGFCDPIQITDTAYNDAAIWVDFTAENPRQFRLGVFGDLMEWNPEGLSADAHPWFLDRLVVVETPPFRSGQWTHVVITYSGLNTESGMARLYLDGERRPGGDTIAESFSWDLTRAAIRLGVNYVGLLDELSLFRRALSEAEVRALHGLENGVAALYQ